jgi:ElaA protein
MLTWQLQLFSQLDALTLYQILELRSEVFVVEQTCIYQDIDDQDQRAIHLLGWQADRLDAYLRILPQTPAKPLALGRIITRKEARGSGVGQALVQRGIDYCQAHWPMSSIHISAQQHLTKFYQSVGFGVSSEPYLEDGIAHIGMNFHPQRRS